MHGNQLNKLRQNLTKIILKKNPNTGSAAKS
jgi:hypothetical protein